MNHQHIDPSAIWNMPDPVFPDLMKTRRILRESTDGDMAAERMNTINAWLRRHFGRKIIKLAIDGAFTCPNRDGTKGTGGCIFCSSTGSGEFSSDISGQIALLEKKWPHAGYLGYFQNHTNTYAPVSELREKYSRILADPRILGLVVATRPDCLPEEVLDYLEELNETCFLWIELGLQTIHPGTARFIRRCYPLEDYETAMRRLRDRHIHVVTHLILGLPGESPEDMRASLRYTVQQGTWGVKLHLLNIMKGTELAEALPDYMPFRSLEDYVSCVTELIGIIPPEVTIHRLTADAPRRLLIAPEWSSRKRTILNGINRELKKRGMYQGCLLGKPAEGVE